MTLPESLMIYLKGRYRPAAYLRFAPADHDDPRATKLTGQPYLEAGEPWPDCSGCGRPLHHLFQVEPDLVTPSALPGCKLLTFFYCPICAPEDSSQPGWHLIRRERLDAPGPARPLPPVPPDPDYSGPLVLKANVPLAARTRLGQDLPSTWDPEIRERLGLNEPNDRASAELGATEVMSIQLKHTETGEITTLRLPMTDDTDPTEFLRHIQAPWSLVAMQLGELQTRDDHAEPYQQLISELRGAEFIASKIGGWIDCWQDPRFEQCACGNPLQHVVTIAFDGGPATFTVADSGAIYLTACPNPTCQTRRLLWWLDYT